MTHAAPSDLNVAAFDKSHLRADITCYSLRSTLHIETCCYCPPVWLTLPVDLIISRPVRLKKGRRMQNFGEMTCVPAFRTCQLGCWLSSVDIGCASNRVVHSSGKPNGTFDSEWSYRYIEKLGYLTWHLYQSGKTLIYVPPPGTTRMRFWASQF